MIGVLFAVQRGIGGGLSTLGGGWVYGALGGRMMWGIAGFIVFPLSLLCAGGFSYLARTYETQSPTVSKADSGSITSDESSLLATAGDYGTTDIYFDHTENFDKMQIGILLTLPCVCAIIAPPIWGGVADIIKNQKLVHIFCLVTAAVFMFSLRFVSTFNVMCIMLLVNPEPLALPRAPPLLDDPLHMEVELAVPVMAAAIGIAWCFNMVLGLSVISLFILLRFIPAYQPDDEGPKTNYLQSLAVIWDQPDVLVLYIVVLLAGIMGGLIDNFLFLW
ncbi:Major Facilitator Superfamily (MFS), partial [Phytophthora palmivora]